MHREPSIFQPRPTAIIKARPTRSMPVASRCPPTRGSARPAKRPPRIVLPPPMPSSRFGLGAYPAWNLLHEFNANGFPTTPDHFASSLWGPGDKSDAKSASDFCSYVGAYLRAGLGDIGDPAFVILAVTVKRNPSQLISPPAHRLVALSCVSDLRQSSGFLATRRLTSIHTMSSFVYLISASFP
jgi:hypothetical protein